MGGMGDTNKERNKQKKARRVRNLDQNMATLIRRGIEFESKNSGFHLIIKAASTTFDFWPSTGRYSERDTGKSGRGVAKLINLIKQQVNKSIKTNRVRT